MSVVKETGVIDAEVYNLTIFRFGLPSASNKASSRVRLELGVEMTSECFWPNYVVFRPLRFLVPRVDVLFLAVMCLAAFDVTHSRMESIDGAKN